MSMDQTHGGQIQHARRDVMEDRCLVLPEKLVRARRTTSELLLKARSDHAKVEPIATVGQVRKLDVVPPSGHDMVRTQSAAIKVCVIILSLNHVRCLDLAPLWHHFAVRQ